MKHKALRYRVRVPYIRIKWGGGGGSFSVSVPACHVRYDHVFDVYMY